MVFQTAGINVPVWLPPLLSFMVAFFASMGGVSGSCLLLPVQLLFFGHAHPSISATNHIYNIVAIPSGIYRYWQERQVGRELTAAIIAGILPGVLLGVVLRIVWLPDDAGFKLFAGFVLLYIGVDLVNGHIRDTMNTGGQKKHAGTAYDHRFFFFTALPGCGSRKSDRIRYGGKDKHYNTALPAVVVLSLFAGLVAGAYGIGGGAIIAPLLVARFGIPVYSVAGATLTASFVSSIVAVAGYHIIALWYPARSIAPDWILGLLFGSGGSVGMYLGALSQKYVSARKITLGLAGIVLCMALGYIAAIMI